MVSDIVDAFNSMPEKFRDNYISHFKYSITYKELGRRNGYSTNRARAMTVWLLRQLLWVDLPVVDQNGNPTGEMMTIVNARIANESLRTEHDLPIACIIPDQKAHSALWENNIVSIPELLHMTEDQLHALPGLSEERYQIIVDSVRKGGYSLGYDGKLSREEQLKFAKTVRPEYWSPSR